MINSSHPQIPNATSKSGPASRAEIFAGVGLFLFLGLFLIFRDLPYQWVWIERK